jgi:hypothetical protein
VTVLQLPDAAELGARTTSWSSAPRVDVLPDRLVLLGYDAAGSAPSVVEVGLPVPGWLQAGPDPNADPADQLKPVGDDQDHPDTLQIPDELAWMFDFERALAVGMAFRFDLTAAQAVFTAWHEPESLILVMSPTERQSSELVRKAAAFLSRLGVRRRGDGGNKISLLLPNRDFGFGYKKLDANLSYAVTPEVDYFYSGCNDGQPFVKAIRHTQFSSTGCQAVDPTSQGVMGFGATFNSGTPHRFWEFRLSFAELGVDPTTWTTAAGSLPKVI